MPSIFDKLSLAGKTALVTGGGTGLGRTFALILARAGADVAVAARRRPPLEESAALIDKLGRKSFTVTADVTRPDQVNAMVAQVVEHFGQIDILVNCAGGATHLAGSLIDMTEAQWREGMDIDLSGALYCSQAVAKHMIPRKTGKIISLSSAAGLMGVTRVPIYAIAKGGVATLTKVLAITLARHGITVNCLAPSTFRTTMMFKNPNDPKELAAVADFLPIGRIGEPEELGPLVVLLASDAGSYISGQTFIIDGGIEADRYIPQGCKP